MPEIGTLPIEVLAETLADPCNSRVTELCSVTSANICWKAPAFKEARGIFSKEICISAKFPVDTSLSTGV
jgi:hypothetical protein